MNKKAKTALIHTTGGALVFLGVGAGFVPFVPGVVLIVVGLYIISFRSLWVKGKLEHVRSKFPKFNLILGKIEGFNEKITRKFHNIFIKK